jgi:hypothetical protein
VAEPYTDVETHLRDELRRAWLRVEYLTRQMGQKTEQIGTDDIAKLFAAAAGAKVSDDESTTRALEQWRAKHEEVEERIAASIEQQIASPLVDIIRIFGLSSRQWGTLAFALLPEVDPNLVQAYRYLARDPTCRGLDGRLLAMLVYDSPESRSLMARDLSPSSPLTAFGLVEVLGGATDSLMFRKIRPASRLVLFLDGGRPELDPELADLAELRAGPVAGAFPALTVDRATAAMHSNEVVLAVQGQRGLGKKLLVQLAAAHWSHALMVIDSKRLGALPPPLLPQTVRALVRELLLLGALPLFADIDDVLVSDGDRDALPPFFDLFLAEWPGPVALTVNRERMPRIHQRPLVHINVEVPPLDVRATMWQQVVPTLERSDAEGLAGRFAIPGGIIVSAAQAALAGRMPGAGPAMPADLDHAVAAQLHQRISRLGKKLPTPYDIDDLIVDDDTRAALTEIAAAARERRKIREQFKLRGAQGISVLFSGHPGVGKTMSATVLARRLGLDIYEIDLSQVVSKWLGETEKNLADVFDAAEPGHVVLLFNEADTLFGKRTSDVKSSNDRYANMETNYLLQRLERFGGVAILTTNLTSAIDQAFKRRFSYDVFFSFPSPDMRAELWQRTLPKERRGTDIDFDALAEKYELSGGFIKVACERAAYVAGASGGEIDDALLRATVERMYRERGKLSAVGPLE